MKNLNALIIVIVIAFSFTDLYSKTKKTTSKKSSKKISQKQKSGKETGYKLGINGGAGVSLAYQPGYNDKSAYWWLMQSNKLGIAAELSVDNYYYFVDYLGINLAAGLYTIQSKWSGTDELNVSHSFLLTGYYAGVRAGPAFKYSGFFLNTDFQFMYNIYSSKEIKSNNYTKMDANRMPIGGAVNFGYRFNAGGVRIPLGIEYIYLYKMHNDALDFKVSSHSVYLFSGIMF